MALSAKQSKELATLSDTVSLSLGNQIRLADLSAQGRYDEAVQFLKDLKRNASRPA